MRVALLIAVLAAVGCGKQTPADPGRRPDGTVVPGRERTVGYVFPNPYKTAGDPDFVFHVYEHDWLGTKSVDLAVQYAGGNNACGTSELNIFVENWGLKSSDPLPRPTAEAVPERVRGLPAAHLVVLRATARNLNAGSDRYDRDSAKWLIRFGSIRQDGATFWYETEAGAWYKGDDAMRTAAIRWLGFAEKERALANEYWAGLQEWNAKFREKHKGELE